MASAACIKIAGVPVEFKVETIFWAILAGYYHPSFGVIYGFYSFPEISV